MEHQGQFNETSGVEKKRVKPSAQPSRNRLVEMHPKNFRRIGMHQGWGH